MSKPKSNRTRLESVPACIEALDAALDLILSVQAAGLRGVLTPNFEPGAERDLASKVAEARGAVTACIAELEGK